MNLLTSPHPKIVGAAGRSDSDIVAAVLGDAGFSRDRIEIVTADEIKAPHDLIAESGLRRLRVQLKVSGEDGLDQQDGERQALMSGYALIQIRVVGREEQVRAHAVVRQDDGNDMQFFERWTITPDDHPRVMAGE